MLAHRSTAESGNNSRAAPYSAALMHCAALHCAAELHCPHSWSGDNRVSATLENSTDLKDLRKGEVNSWERRWISWEEALKKEHIFAIYCKIFREATV